MDETAKVIFVGQKRSWDCGVACLKMALGWCGHTDLRETPLDAINKSIWTIDIFKVLNEYNVRCVMYTRNNCGVLSEHRELNWYRDDTGEESARVASAFQKARANQWNIIVGSLDIQAMVDLLDKGAILIVLVDVDKLRTACDPSRRDFRGHFILVTRCDIKANIVEYLDPAVSDGSKVFVSTEVFDVARMAPGTDEDVIVCFGATSPAAAPIDFIVIFDYLKDNNVLLSLSFHRVPVRKINDKVITYYEPTRYTKKNDEKRNKRSAAGAVPRAVLRQ